MSAGSFKGSFLAQYLNGTLYGSDPEVRGIATLADALEGQLSFLSNSRYRKQLAETRASLVLIRSDDLPSAPCPAIVVTDPYLAYARVSQLFTQDPSKQPSGIALSAQIASDAEIDPSAVVAAGVVIESGARIAADVYLGPNTVVGARVQIGCKTRVEANVTLYPDVRIGADCLIHSGAVIGSDGFGFAPSSEGWEKIAQLGSVLIGDQVEIGSNTTIDRGALSDTIIENGVKLDNQIQIAHNVRIGEYTAIAGGVAIAGSTEIGKRCTIAGMSGITGHLKIADGTHITAMTLVSRSIGEAGAYSSGTAMEPHAQWKRNVVRFRQLDQLAKRLAELEQRVEELSRKG